MAHKRAMQASITQNDAPIEEAFLSKTTNEAIEENGANILIAPPIKYESKLPFP